MNRKKAQLGNLPGLIIGLVVIGIVIVVGLLIAAQMKTQVVAEIDTSNTVEESVVWSNDSFVALTNNTGVTGLACTGVRNSSTAGELLSTDNYTCSPSGINVVDQSSDGNVSFNTTVIVNYTWKAETYAFNATGEVQNVTQTIPGWLGIVVVTVIGGFLIGLILKLFRG